VPGAPGLRWLKSPPSGDFPFSRASMSAIPSEADISRSCQHVSFVPLDETARAVGRRGSRHDQDDSASGGVLS